MTSLTDRYVDATLRSIPSRQRPDLERELRASIADAMEDQSEAEALAEFGDPDRLAASYTDRPLHLIGPTLYLDYRRVLAVLLSSIVPLVFVAVAVAAFPSGAGFADAVTSAAGAALLVGMHILIWVTVVFALIERTRTMRARRARRWDPVRLTDLPSRRFDIGALLGGSIVVAVIAAALIVVQGYGPVSDESGRPVGLITPAVWDSGVLLLVVLFAAAAIALDLVAYYVGWGITQALATTLLSILFVSGTIVLARSGDLLNREFFAAIDWQAGAGPDGVVTWIIIAFVVLISIPNVVGGFSRLHAPATRP
jgi:hypothetical protein